MTPDPAMDLFGSNLRTKTLVYLALLKETYVPQLADLLGLSAPTVRRVLEDLERQGYVTSMLEGRERWVRLNPRNPVAEPLRMLLIRLAEGRPELIAAVSRLRRRPRRRGKDLGPANDA
jgi:DNA-binding transcriptional ArsR family regulator